MTNFLDSYDLDTMFAITANFLDTCGEAEPAWEARRAFHRLHQLFYQSTKETIVACDKREGTPATYYKQTVIQMPCSPVLTVSGAGKDGYKPAQDEEAA